jgi:hypothetical protein
MLRGYGTVQIARRVVLNSCSISAATLKTERQNGLDDTHQSSCVSFLRQYCAFCSKCSQFPKLDFFHQDPVMRSQIRHNSSLVMIEGGVRRTLYRSLSEKLTSGYNPDVTQVTEPTNTYSPASGFWRSM